jgi:hypothetical protein
VTVCSGVGSHAETSSIITRLIRSTEHFFIPYTSLSAQVIFKSQLCCFRLFCHMK